MSPPKQLRLFIAIAIPETVKTAIAVVQNELRRALPGISVRWTPPDQFHVTLRFLGNVAPEKLPALESSIREVSARFPPTEMSAEHVGRFPERGLPRVIWVGIRDAGDRLQELQHALQEATLQFGSEPPEKRFAGHVTVGRIKDVRCPQAEALARAMAGLVAASFGQWTTPTVELMRSELSPAGATHTTLAELPFKTQSSQPRLS